MIDLGLTPSRWFVPLLVCLLLVAATGLPSAAVNETVPLLAGVLLVIAAFAWYASLDVRQQPEALPKMRLAGVAALVLLMTLLYDLLVGALGLPGGLGLILLTGLLGVSSVALVVIIAALVDLSVMTRQRWPRYVGAVVVAGVPVSALLAALHAHDSAGAPSLLPDPIVAVAPLAAGSLLLAFIAPLEWSVVLDTRQRLATLFGWVVAIVPLAFAVAIETWLEGSHQHFLIACVRYAAVAAILFLVVTVARAVLSLPGARAYERKVRELDAVYDFGLTAGTAFDPAQLQAAILDSMMRVSEPDVAVVVEADANGPGTECVLLRADNAGQHVYRFRSRAAWAALAGQFADRRPLAIADHRKVAPDFLRRIWEPASGSSVIVPVATPDGQLRAVLVAGRFERHSFNAAEVRSLTGFATQVGLAMDHARLLRDTVESERRKHELDIARKLQLNMLPAEPPQRLEYDIAARSDPATEVGGDYFDYLDLPNGNLAVVVGDVSGHGMPAGLLMAIAKSAIHTQVRSDVSLHQLMIQLGETLLAMAADSQFMTLVLAELDAPNGVLRYSNAGHHYPLHFRARTGGVHELESNGIPLGLLPRPPGPFLERPLEPGDVLVFYSDGVVEAGVEGDDMFGVTRLTQVVLANRERGAKTMVEAVFQAVGEFCGEGPLHDDATIVVVRVLDCPPREGNDGDNE